MLILLFILLGKFSYWSSYLARFDKLQCKLKNARFWGWNWITILRLHCNQNHVMSYHNFQYDFEQLLWWKHSTPGLVNCYALGKISYNEDNVHLTDGGSYFGHALVQWSLLYSERGITHHVLRDHMVLVAEVHPQVRPVLEPLSTVGQGSQKVVISVYPYR